MKISILSIFACALFLFSCNNEPKGETTEAAETQEAAAAKGDVYTIEPSSSLGFYGATPTHAHDGSFAIKEGTLTVENGNITAGNFSIDISSMKSADKDTTDAYKLIGHLLSPDFFDAAKYPTAKFEITTCEASKDSTVGTHLLSGNLTLKDSTKNVSFPISVKTEGNNILALGKVTIDRTQWGMHYGNDESLKDKFIYPKVDISINLVATKK